MSRKKKGCLAWIDRKLRIGLEARIVEVAKLHSHKYADIKIKLNICETNLSKSKTFIYCLISATYNASKQPQWKEREKT